MLNIIASGLNTFSDVLDRKLVDVNLKQKLDSKEKQLEIDYHRISAELELELSKAKLQAEIKPLELLGEIDKQQISLNQAEVSHKNIFIAGWRPAIGWISALGFCYTVILQPILSSYFPSLKPIDHSLLMNVLIGMLGLGGLRTYEKIKSVHNKH